MSEKGHFPVPVQEKQCTALGDLTNHQKKYQTPTLPLQFRKNIDSAPCSSGPSNGNKNTTKSKASQPASSPLTIRSPSRSQSRSVHTNFVPQSRTDYRSVSRLSTASVSSSSSLTQRNSYSHSSSGDSVCSPRSSSQIPRNLHSPPNPRDDRSSSRLSFCSNSTQHERLPLRRPVENDLQRNLYEVNISKNLMFHYYLKLLLLFYFILFDIQE